MTREAGPPDPRASEGAGITRFVTRGNHRLSSEIAGPLAGIPVLALHDLLTDRGQFRPVGEALAASGFRLLLPDARGHGASATISGRVYPTDELAADALALLDAEGVAMAHVVAIGWSAATALSLAAQAPRRVASLVLAAPYAPGLLLDHPDEEARLAGATYHEAIEAAVAAAERGLTDQALDLFLDPRWGAGWRDRLPRTRLGAMRRAAGNLAPLLAGTIAAPLDREALRRLDVPAIVLLAADASAVERWSGEALATWLPRGRVEAMPGEENTSFQGSSSWMAAVARTLLAQRG